MLNWLFGLHERFLHVVNINCPAYA